MRLSRFITGSLAGLLVFIPLSARQEAEPYPWRVSSLSLEVDLRPIEGALAAEVDLLLAPREGDPPPGTIDFFLNRELAVSAVEVNGRPATWSIGDAGRIPFAPAAVRITVPATEASGHDAGLPGGLKISVKYTGRLIARPKSPSRITPALTELNLYAAWIPLFAGPQGFPWEMEVSAPATHVVVTNGVETDAPGSLGALRRSAGENGPQGTADKGGDTARRRMRFSGRSAAGDVALVASPYLTRVGPLRASLCEAEIFVPARMKVPRGDLGAEVAWACDFIERRTGGGEGSSHDLAPLRVVVVPREDEGYARPPLVVVPEGWFAETESEASPAQWMESEWRRRLYHEIAHALSPLADTGTTDDWINEGLAEHLALQALSARRGSEAAARYFRSYILDLAERLPTPPFRPGPAASAKGPAPQGAGEPQTPAPDENEGGAAEPAAGAAPESGKNVSATLTAEDLEAVRIRLAPISATRRGDPDAPLLYYRKGALIFRMIESIVGPDQWRSILRDLKRSYPASSARRLDTAALIEAFEKGTGREFAWIRRDWFEGSGLPELEAHLEVRRAPVPGIKDRHLVSGEIVEKSARGFRLVVPLLARRGAEQSTTLVELAGSRAAVNWFVPFEPSEVLLDPRRFIPRVDTVAREALRLRRMESRAGDLAQAGLAAERQGNFVVALRRYDETAAADPSSPFPWYRRGRVLSALGAAREALDAHHRAARLADREAIAADRIRSALRSAATPMQAPPGAWVDPDPDLRAWNWIRIGQIEDQRGRRRAARRAYARALECPDFRGAHGEARHYLATPYEPPARDDRRSR